MSDFAAFATLLSRLGITSGNAPQQAQPTQQAQARPQSGMVGKGLAKGAADVDQYYKRWQAGMMDAQMQGAQYPDFDTWMRIQGVARPPVMPR